MIKPTRTEDTEAAYVERAESLLKRYLVVTGKEWRSDPIAACKWIADKREEWSKATWRYYRSSLVCFMETNGPVEAVEYLEKQSSAQCKRRSTKTSAQKMKKLSDDDLLEILNKLNPKRGKYDLLVGLWLTTNRHFGLRPVEWSTAKVEDDRLIVKNAKTTNGRGLGAERHLLLGNMPDENKKALCVFIEEFQNHLGVIGDENALYVACKKRLWQICRKLWPKRRRHPTLYSPRHQLSADMKASGFELTEIAAVFGHAVDRTSVRHYGKKRSGRGGNALVQPDPVSVAKVRKVYSGRPADLPGQTVKE